jgi:hypothetical protein
MDGAGDVFLSRCEIRISHSLTWNETEKCQEVAAFWPKTIERRVEVIMVFFHLGINGEKNT